MFIFTAFLIMLFFLELSHRREREEMYRFFGKDEKKPHSARHISPHRKTLDEKRRINK